VNQTLAYSQIFLDKLTASLIKEPSKSFIDECQPPSLIAVDDIDCFKYLTAFTGIKRQVCAQMMQGVGSIALSLIN
jgi:sulfur relay (sulfurtransferase) DsrF/TusC family protein